MNIKQKARQFSKIAQDEIRNDPAAAALVILVLMITTDILFLLLVF